MPGKRGNSEGTIRKRPDGRWEARLVLPDGQRKSLYGKTRQDAARQLDQAKQDRKDGVTAFEERQTLQQCLAFWLQNVKKRQVRASGYARYVADVNLHLIPGLGKVRLSKLTAQQVQALYSSKIEAGYAPATVQHMHVALHDALNYAVDLGLIHHNVVDRVKPPRTVRREMTVLSEEQARALLAAVKGDRLEALLVLAISTGMREGELIALRWTDVNLEKASLQVRRTLQRGLDGFSWDDTKTRHSRRTIALSDNVVAALRSHRARQAEERLRLGDAWQDLDLVFSNAAGGRPTFRTPIQHFLGLSESATNPGAMRHCSSRPNIFQDHRYLGTL
jgi:integrase